MKNKILLIILSILSISINALAYDGSNFTDSGSNLTHTNLTISASCTLGSNDMAIDGTYIYINNSTGGDSTCSIIITADGTNTASFEFSGISFQEFSAANNYTNIKIIGTKTDDSTIQSANTIASDNGTANTYSESHLGMGSFSGVQIKSFKLSFDTAGVQRPDGMTLNSFSLINLTAPSSNSAPAFDAGATNTLAIAEDASATDIKAKLLVTDSDGADTLTWSQSSGPAHGTLNFSSATAGAGTNVSSGGTITYTPTANYNGADSFVVQVSDTTDTDTITVNVTVSADNDASTDISLDSTTVAQSGGANAVVGNLTTTDVDSTDTFTYTLVSGTGSTNNGSFNINSAELRANDASALSAGAYDVRVNTYDGTGNFEKTFSITITDDINPTVSSVSVPSNTTYIEGEHLDFTVNTNENVTVVTTSGTPRIALTIGATTKHAEYLSGTGTSALIFRYTVEAGLSDTDGIAVGALAANSGTLEDSVGNSLTTTLNSVAATTSVLVDSTPPTVSSVTSITANGDYKEGEVITITVVFDEVVAVTGTPQITLETGTTDRVVDYVSGTGTNTLTFNYTVQAGDITADLDYKSTSALALNSGTIKDAAGNDATLTLATPGAANSLGNNKALIIDTAPATVQYVSSSTADGTFKVGDVVAVTVVFNENMTVTGTPQITLETGDTDRTVDYTSGTGSTTLTFNYTVQAGDTSADLDYTGTSVLVLNSGTIKDAAGNDATLTLATPGAANSLGNNKALVIDGNVPTVTSVSVPANDSYKEGENLDFTVNTSEAITITGSPRLTLTVGAATKYATYSSGTGTTALVFRYTVGAGETDTDGIVIAGTLDANSGTLNDSAGNTLTTTLNSIGATTAILVDTTNPTTSTLSPADDSTGKSITSNLVLTLSEDAVVGTGDILIKKTSGDVLVETIPVGDARVSISGAIITINPNATLDINTEYYIIVPATAFDDTAGNSFAGLTATTDWSFTTAADATAPTIASISIPNTPSKIGDIITVTFTVTSDSDDYTTGSGGVSGTIGGYALSGFTKVNDTTYTAQYTITSGGTDVASSADIPVNFTMTDSAGNVTASYTTAISQSNDGLDSNIPTVSSLSPADDATEVANTSNLVITLNEDATIGTGNILIKKTSDDSTIETIDVTSSLVSISGAVVTINPNTTLALNTEYYVIVPDTAFDDSVGNSFAGITVNNDWSFTTADVVPTILTGDINITSIPDVLVDINTSKFIVDNNQSNDYNVSGYFTNATNYSYILKDSNATVNWLSVDNTLGNFTLDTNIVDNNSSLLDTKHYIKITGLNSDTNISTYFTLRFKDLNASLAEYMDGNVTLSGVVETDLENQTASDGREYDQKNFKTSDLNITTQIFNDGSARHEITDRAIAESKLPDSKITISTNGDLNTSTSTINNSGDTMQIEVLGMATGDTKSTHTVLINGVTTKATSNLPNTITTIRADRVVETNATISGASISVLAKTDGKAEHTVKVGGQTTIASVELAGGQTAISTAGVVTTTYGIASAVTSVTGTTQIQLNGESLLNGDFEAGNTVKIYEDGSGDEYIEVSTPAATSTTQYLIN